VKQEPGNPGLQAGADVKDEELTAEERRIIGWLKRQVAEAEQLQELMARREEWGEAHHHKIKALAWGLAIDAIRRRERAP
jgi:hypothetical protein